MNTMATENKSSIDSVTDSLWRGVHYVTSSFFRFLIAFGVLLVVIAATLLEGIVAGHLGIYGITAIVTGIAGRLIVNWKLKDDE